MKLPKLYRVVRIKFWSLRNAIGHNMGAINDVDILIEQYAMRVACKGGWKWQIKDLAKLCEWDHWAAVDQEILNEFGSELELESTESYEEE